MKRIIDVPLNALRAQREPETYNGSSPTFEGNRLLGSERSEARNGLTTMFVYLFVFFPRTLFRIANRVPTFMSNLRDSRRWPALGGRSNTMTIRPKFNKQIYVSAVRSNAKTSADEKPSKLLI